MPLQVMSQKKSSESHQFNDHSPHYTEKPVMTGPFNPSSVSPKRGNGLRQWSNNSPRVPQENTSSPQTAPSIQTQAQQLRPSSNPVTLLPSVRVSFSTPLQWPHTTVPPTLSRLNRVSPAQAPPPPESPGLLDPSLPITASTRLSGTRCLSRLSPLLPVCSSHLLL
jgi:hypothetical protein